MTGTTSAIRGELQFFTTAGCRLCDEALERLRPVAYRRGFRVEQREILADPAAEAAYGESIPVVRRADSGRELRWPFTDADLYRFLL